MELALKESLCIENFRLLPLHLLRPSALVDFVLFFANAKPAVRLQINSDSSFESLDTWCSQAGFELAIDKSNFLCIAKSKNYAEYVLQLDQLEEPHEIELGIALGYPECCCQKIAVLGESNIDNYSLEISKWMFKDEYSYINPNEYISGVSLISHLPCAPDCFKSLKIALQTRKFILENSNELFLNDLVNSPLLNSNL